MSRRPRIFVPGFPLHVVQRGNNRRTIFLDDADRRTFLRYLVDATDRHGCPVHCYVLMGNHVHLLVTPGAETALACTMQSVGIRYVRYFNARHKRTGGLWEGRYRASLVDTDRYLAACYRYIELNPVRACLVADPADWPWSSFRHHACGEPNSVVSRHSYYTDLGDSDRLRCQRYQSLIRQGLTDGEIETIRQATRQGLVAAGEAARRQLEDTTGRTLRAARSGRKKIGV